MYFMRRSTFDCREKLMVSKISYFAKLENNGKDVTEGFDVKLKEKDALNQFWAPGVSLTGDCSTALLNSPDPYALCLFTNSASKSRIEKEFKGDTYIVKDLDNLVDLVKKLISEELSTVHNVVAIKTFTGCINYGLGDPSGITGGGYRSYERLGSGGLLDFAFSKPVRDPKEGLFADESEYRLVFAPVVMQPKDTSIELKIPDRIELSSTELSNCFLKIDTVKK